VNPGDNVIGDDDGACMVSKEIEEEALNIVRLYGERNQAVVPTPRQGKSVADTYAINNGWEKAAGLEK